MGAPRFSILTPVYETPAGVLRAMLRSVRRQRFGDWELCLVDDASTAPHVAARCSSAAERRGPRGSGSAPRGQRRHRRGLQRRAGDGPRASSSPCSTTTTSSTPKRWRWSRRRSTQSRRPTTSTPTRTRSTASACHFGPFFKPDWSPERMRTQMYTCHLSVLRRSLVEEVGGFDPEFEGSQDWDLVLKVTERARAVVHVPRVLYHWRALETSTAGGGEDAKPWAFEAGTRAVAGPLRADRAAGPGRARRGSCPASTTCSPALDRRAEGQHRDPHQRAAARGPLRGGDAGRALRAQHRRELQLRQLRDRLRRRRLDRPRRARRARGDRRRPPAARPLRRRVQLLGEDQPRRRPQRGRAPAAAQRRHGGRHPGLDRADGDVRAEPGDRRRRRPPALGGRAPPARRGPLRGRASRPPLPRLHAAASRATRTTPAWRRTASRSPAPA